MSDKALARSALTRLILRRLAVGILMLFMVSLIIFFATQALPGDIARQLLGQNATEDQLARVRAELGLDRPVLLQYLDWIGGLLTGDLGTSLASGTPVVELLAVRIGNSATMLLIAALIVLPLGMVLGTIAARRPGGAIDAVISTTMQLILALPEFIVGILLILLLAGGALRVLPPTSPIDPRESIWAQADLLVLPVATLVLIALPHLAESVKTLVRDELASDAVRWARLSGVRESRTLFRHALPNVLGPTAQVAGVTVNYLIGGAVAVETVFAYPGIGSALVSAVANRDIVVVQVIGMGIALVLFVTFLVADFIGYLVEPRLREGRA
ncbi:MAG: ABC transporter permease [Microbacterium sp.]